MHRFAASVRDGSNYFVLLILTDGEITDTKNTIDAIVNVSQLCAIMSTAGGIKIFNLSLMETTFLYTFKQMILWPNLGPWTPF